MKKKWREILIREKTYFNKGLGEVSGLKTFVSLFLLTSVYLNQLGIVVRIEFIVTGFVIILIGLRTFGWLWDKSHLYIEEAEFGNRRNHLSIEIRKELKRIKQR